MTTWSPFDTVCRTIPPCGCPSTTTMFTVVGLAAAVVVVSPVVVVSVVVVAVELSLDPQPASAVAASRHAHASTSLFIDPPSSCRQRRPRQREGTSEGGPRPRAAGGSADPSAATGAATSG